MTDVSAADTTMLKDTTTAPLKYQHRIEKKIHHSRVSIESLKDGILSRTYYILLILNNDNTKQKLKTLAKDTQ